MSLNMITMKARLIWNEHLPHNDSKLYPYISFDEGLSWMDISKEVDDLRSIGSNGLNIISTDNNISELDLSVGFTPYAIPSIEKLELKSSLVPTNFNKLKGTKYYFGVGALNYDTPGLNVIAETDHITYTGPINPVTSAPYISNVKAIELPAGAGDTDFYDVDIYINYPNFIKGLCIYYGTNPNAMKLMSITNLHNILAGVEGLTVIPIGGTTVKLTNIFPLPTNTGVVKINDEYLEYKEQSYNSGQNAWTLTLLNGATKAHKGGSIVQYVLPEEKRSLPEKINFFPDVTNMVQYINFDANNVRDLVDHNGHTGYVQPTPIGDIEYSTYMSKFEQSYKAVGNTCIQTDLGPTLRNSLKELGSIHFYLSITSFNTNETEDPYIFGTYNNTGLYCRVSRFNYKPYVGFKYKNVENELIDILIFSPEDYRIPVLKKNEFSDIGIAWAKDTDGKMIFNFSIDKTENLKTKTNILSSDFDIGALTICGLYNGTEVINSFVGYFDDWRIYNKNLADGSYSITFKDIKINHFEDVKRFAGKITLGKEFLGAGFDAGQSYDTVDNKNLLAYGKTAGSTCYTPKFHTKLDLSAVYDTVYDIDKPLIKYDNWIINAFIAGWSNVFPDITYPVKPKMIKVKYELKDDTTGFFTPMLGNPSTIISEITV